MVASEQEEYTSASYQDQKWIILCNCKYSAAQVTIQRRSKV